MEFLKKYQEFKRHVLSIAEQHSCDKEIRKNLEEFDEILNEKLQKLHHETKKYRVLFENFGDYIFVVSNEGIVLEVNSSACKKYGMSHDVFINKSIFEVDASENKDEIMKKIEELLKVGSTRFEALHRNRKGEIFNVDVMAQKIMWNGKPAVLEVCRDITIQKELEKALNDSEVKLKNIINQITDGLVIFDKSGRIIVWNSGAEEITGIKKQNVIGKFFYDLQYKLAYGKYKDHAALKKRFDEVVNMGDPTAFSTLIEHDILVEDKGVRTIQAKVFHIDLGNGNQLFGTASRDITEQKMAETQLKDLLATKDKIYSIIAHDLRTPFNSIIGFTDLLLNNYDNYDKDRILKILKFINLSSKPMLDVLTNMLNWVHAQTGQLAFHPQPQPLKFIIREVVEIMKSTAEFKNIQLNQFMEQDFIVMADVNMLQSVLQNLVANAIKFSHSGGKVDVYARQKNNFVELEVSDEGVGIDEQKKDSLFRLELSESSRGTSGEKGSGLGLILCKEFIERHGGEI
ncbi:MAG: PAS domain S-box protein, partial [Bacteroidota bacterium]